MTFDASITTKSLLACALALLISIISGCSISQSVGSISESISSPSDWSKSSSKSSSESSSGDEDSDEGEEPEPKPDAETFAADVTSLAYTYAKQGGDIGALRNGVSALAAKRGLTNWEVDSLTCESIGKGVGKAGMTQEDFTQFSKNLFGDDLTKANHLREGYETEMPSAAAADSPSS